MRRICILVPGLAGIRTFTVEAGARAPRPAPRPGPGPAHAGAAPNQVILWNRLLLGLHSSSAAPRVALHPTRILALMHLAIADAVGAVSGRFSPYRFRGGASRFASQNAAAASAAYEVLVALYPSLKSTLDAELARSLLSIRNGSGKTAGIAIGSDTAMEILRFGRHHDEAGRTPMAPLALRRPDQFRPEPPPAVVSDEYAGCRAEVRSIGAEDSLTRTPDQTEIARFWCAPIQHYWNRIAQTASLAHHNSAADDARLFALLNLSFADGVVALCDAKDAFMLGRPVTAITEEGGPAAASWAPLLPTPAAPSYPSACSAISASAATVLAREFGDRFDFSVASVPAPALPRSFSSFSAAAQEAGLSRIYAGQHFRFDHDAGKQLGRTLAEYVGRLCYYQLS